MELLQFIYLCSLTNISTKNSIVIRKDLKMNKILKAIQTSLSFAPLAILILYFITRSTLGHDNLIFLTISFLLNFITTIIITFSLITAYIEFKEKKKGKFKIAFWTTLLVLSQVSAIFSDRYTLFERSGVFIADILAIMQILYLIKENKKKGLK